MSYIDSVLINGEHVLYRTHLHWFILVTPIILCVFMIGVILLPSAVMARISSEFAVTNKRVIIKTGFISRRAFDTSLDKVEGIIIDQGVLGRLLGYGTVLVRGTGGASLPFKNVADPFLFKRMVDEAIETRRKG